MNTNLMNKLLAVAACLLVAAATGDLAAAEGPKRILATTFPIYQITRNVIHGSPTATVDLMIPASLGCPHDYALTPQDMQKLAAAEVLVVNGLGMEEFLGAPVRKANSKIILIDSSKNISGILDYPEEDGHTHEKAASKHSHGKKGDKDKKSKHSHHEHDHHGGPNPHLFASPRMAAQLAANIATELSAIDPSNAALYTRNAKDYSDRLNRLADEFVQMGKTLRNPRVVTQHGVFDYLAADMGLEIVGVVQAHPGQEPSAAEMLKLTKAIKEKQAGALFTEPQYPPKVGAAIAKETGIPVALLDPAANGPDTAPLDYYETVMLRNLETIKATLGKN
jgi:ABC-type Zn uptake system ZnuABC Zn-binding protein ZnuA